jgi:hypothetical protein
VLWLELLLLMLLMLLLLLLMLLLLLILMLLLRPLVLNILILPPTLGYRSIIHLANRRTLIAGMNHSHVSSGDPSPPTLLSACV